MLEYINILGAVEMPGNHLGKAGETPVYLGS